MTPGFSEAVPCLLWYIRVERAAGTADRAYTEWREA